MKTRFRFLIFLFAAWLPAFIVQRPWFMIYNSQLADSVSPADYFQVIAHGLLLDCTMAGYLTVIPLLLTFVSVWIAGEWLRKVLKVYFLAASLLIAAIFVVDVALYAYWGFRLDGTALFYLRSPKDAMASVPAGLFVRQITAFFVYAGLVYFYLSKALLPLVPTDKPRRRVLASGGCILLGGLMFIPIRGGLTTSTANVGMVYFSDDQFLNHAAINPCFSLFSSISKQEDFAAQFDFFPEEERAAIMQELQAEQTPAPGDAHLELLNTARPDILFVILESFSANTVEVTGGAAGVTPNLNRLSKEGVLFTNMYANSFRTDRGLVAILNGYPAQPTTSIMKYPAKAQTLPALAHSLGQEGYVSDVLYGGDINFTNMHSYFFGSGYSGITCDKDFPIKDRLSKWGVNDDVTFRHLFEEMKQREAGGHRMTTFLTLSSHEPFDVPYRRLEHPYLNSVAFTDSCLGDFIDKLRALPVWENLLVVMVADHGFRYPERLKEYEPDRYHVPMLWLGGAVEKPAVIDAFCSQTDIAATLLGQMGIPHDEYVFSKDILQAGTPKYAFYTFKNGFGVVDSAGYVVYDNEGGRVLLESDPSASPGKLEIGEALLQTLYDDLGSRGEHPDEIKKECASAK